MSDDTQGALDALKRIVSYAGYMSPDYNARNASRDQKTIRSFIEGKQAEGDGERIVIQISNTINEFGDDPDMAMRCVGEFLDEWQHNQTLKRNAVGNQLLPCTKEEAKITLKCFETALNVGDDLHMPEKAIETIRKVLEAIAQD
ncbi:MAG: hypothetical protein O7D95_05090 [Betaproteobacteria bacterium]|nr:hypothetical protein [Betaproteobacteria bacterium]